MLEWTSAWEGIYTAIRDCGIIPIVHLVMHGNADCVGIKKGQAGIVLLPDLFEKVRTANELSKNNIFLSMAVCEGLNVIRNISISQHMPFCGILASESCLMNGEALENCTLFYETLFETLNVDDAEDVLRANGMNEKDYSLCKPEEVFMNAMIGYLENESRDDKIEERAKKIASMGNIDIHDPLVKAEFVEKVRELVKKEDAKGYVRFVEKFFMLDLYPEIAVRFSIPKTLDEFKTWAKSKGANL